MSEENILNIPLEFWFNANPKLAIPMARLSYGLHTDENGRVYEKILIWCGNSSEIYREYKDENPNPVIGLGIIPFPINV